MRATLAQIVPALSPPANGVGDYALVVARELRAQFAIDTEFVVGTPGGVRSEVGGFRVHTVSERSPAALREALERLAGGGAKVLLQLSPYGYENNGCPFWLARGLRAWMTAETAGRRLMTMFHELFAMGPPWTRTFWVSPLQRRATRQILELSAVAMTGVEKFSRQLRTWRGGRALEIHCLPVASSVGEPTEVEPLAGRRRSMCVFGIRAGARQIDAPTAHLLRALLPQLGIEDIAVIGDMPHLDALRSLGFRLTPYAGLPAAEVSGILSGSILGLSWYPPEVLAKSSVFAAYCAHGVATLVLEPGGGQEASSDGLEDGVHYLTAKSLGEEAGIEQLQRVADSGRTWYAGHQAADHARLVAECLRLTP